MRRELTQLLALAVLVAATTALVPARAEAQNQGSVGAGRQNQGMVSAADMQRAQEAYQADLQRQAIARDKPGFVANLMSRWSADIGETERGRVGFETALLADNPEKLLKMSQAKTWDAVMAIQLGFDPANGFGSESTDLVFNPLPPCRVLDSRFGIGPYAGPYASGATISLYVTDPFSFFGNNQGGLPSGFCGFPQDVGTAAALNITVVPTVGSASGDLKVYPFGAAPPNASIINFYGGVNLANAANVQVAPTIAASDLTIRVEFASSVHIIVDIMGYYSKPNATALQNIRVSNAGTLLNGDVFSSNPLDSPLCPGGYTMVGGGFNMSGGTSPFTVWQNSPGDNPPTFWRFRGVNNTGVTVTVTVYGDCARVPGR